VSSAVNHRRGHAKIQERGPRYENRDPSAGCNATHVAKGRKRWKLRDARKERRLAKLAVSQLHGKIDA